MSPITDTNANTVSAYGWTSVVASSVGHSQRMKPLNAMFSYTNEKTSRYLRLIWLGLPASAGSLLRDGPGCTLCRKQQPLLACPVLSPHNAQSGTNLNQSIVTIWPDCHTKAHQSWLRGNSSAQLALEDCHNNPNHRSPELNKHVNTLEGTKACPGWGQVYTKTNSIYNYVQLNTSTSSHTQT